MSVSRCLFLLPLGLLIALPGCSGSRMRQIFAPEREFMALSELREYEAQKAADPAGAGRTEGFLASLSRRKSTEGDESADDKKRLLSLSRWLPSNKDEALPADPFVGIDDDVTDESPAAAEPVVTVGLSDELMDEIAAETVPDPDAFEPKWPVADEAEEEVAIVPEPADRDSENLPTFADIMAEFDGEEGFEESADEMDELAEQWLVSQSASADPTETTDPSEVVDDRELTDFEALLAEATAAVTPATQPEDDEVPGLNFDRFDDEEPADDNAIPLVDLPERDVDQNRFDAASEDQDADPSVTIDQLVAEDRLRHDPVGRQDDSWEIADSQAPSEPLWPDSSIAQTDPPEVSAEPQDSGAAPLEDLMGDWDFGPPAGSPVTAMEQPREPQPMDHIESARSDFRPPAFDHPATRLPARPTSTAPAAAPAVVAADVFDDTRFLSDFEAQAAAATPAEDPEPPAAAGGGFISRQSPRTWLLLLGAVIIGYLLLAPERQNLRHSNNR